MKGKKQKHPAFEAEDPSPQRWRRLRPGEPGAGAAVPREVDEALVEELLRDRWAAKVVRDFSTADEKSDVLKNMRIAYHDHTRTWYALPEAPQVKSSWPTEKVNPKKSKRQERNRRQAEKNRKKAMSSGEGGSIATESDAASEDEGDRRHKKRRGGE